MAKFAARTETVPPRLLPFPEVCARTSLSRSAIYRHVARGTFPRPCKLGTKKVGWLEADINAYIQNLPRQTYVA
ncbi:MAG: AlpA family transcriptional regulator [Hyphomicrobiaceae bacterium]|nr:MAG: AlpA family transcriptional regulator [Hyphomicrobiaceae bacterium]